MSFNPRLPLASAAIAGLLLSSPLLLAQDQRITRQQLPAAVQHAVETETQGSTIKGFATEVENGSRTYEAETLRNGRSRDISFHPDGSVAEVEEEVPLAQLPANVRQSLQSKARGARIAKVESLTKHHKLVAYEAATVNSSGHHGEVQVGPDGQTLAHEE